MTPDFLVNQNSAEFDYLPAMDDFSKLKAGDPVAIYTLGNRGLRLDVKKWIRVTTISRNTGRRLYFVDDGPYNFDGSCADRNSSTLFSGDPEEVALASRELAAEAQRWTALKAEQEAFEARADVKLAREIIRWETAHGIEDYLRVGEEKLRAFAEALREANPRESNL